MKPPTSPTLEEIDDFFPTNPASGTRTHVCYAAIFDYSRQRIFTDQTWRFIMPSSTGNNQIFLLYNDDSNSIWAEAMKSKTGPAILAAYKTVHKQRLQAGLQPILQ